MNKLASNRHLLRVALVVLACGATITHAQQKPQLPGSYPNKPIRILLPSTPGGGGDTSARAVMQKLSERWGSSFVMDNRPGAVGAIAIDLAAKATPDGYTLLVGSGNPFMHAALVTKSYDIQKIFAPISQFTSQPYVLAVNLSLPVNSVKELIAYAKSKPGALNYGSSGMGGAAHLGMELFKSMAGVDMVHIPYKGISLGIIDLLGGHVQLLLGSTISVMSLVKSGKLKAIAVTSLNRSRLLPDLPTISEAGLSGFDVTNWYGLVTPAGTPPAIVLALNREITQVLDLPDIRGKFAADGAEPAPGSPEQFSDTITKELHKWAKLIKQLNLKL